ncbi:MAG: hypothetical protein Tsb009_35340 [Planctomycetaceae bacterium]
MKPKTLFHFYTMIVLLLQAFPFIAEASSPVVSPARKNADGFLVHTVTSEYQSGATTIRVLLPSQFRPKKKYRVLYVLPVEAKNGSRYGDGLLEVKKAGLHDKYHLICVAPTFSHLPWYADHPHDKTIRQETYFLKVVVPFIERKYPAVQHPRGRLLIGFSKSGWGAFSLLLRHPNVFGKAAAWDAPLMKDKPNQFGMKPIFGTQANFEGYQLSSLIKKQARRLGTSKRLVLTGYGNFRDHHQRFERLLKSLKIPLESRDGPRRRHHWNSGWLPETVSLLAQ